jgi:hypothetical protein
LEDKNSVKEWAIKYNILHIILADGKEIEVQPIGWMDNIDYKYPEEEEIEDAQDYGVDEEEEEDEKIDNSTVISGILCNNCNNVLPPHTCEQHLDINNSIHKCPHSV